MFIYLDESGESTGFGKVGSSDTFNIALIICQDSRDIISAVRGFEKSQLKSGWPSNIEIKAANIFRAKFNPEILESYKHKYKAAPQLVLMLEKLSKCNLEIDYISVRKENLYDSLKAAPFGIVYNYLSWQVLKPRLQTVSTAHLIVDALNKEVHSGKHFDGYIETRAFESLKSLRSFKIEHLESHQDRRLRAVDYVSWAIFRKYEKKDERFYKIIRNKMNTQNCKAWFH